MSDKIKLQNALNFARSKLLTEMQPKMDKHHKNYELIGFIEKIIQKLI